jgi:hypothetical protein
MPKPRMTDLSDLLGAKRTPEAKSAAAPAAVVEKLAATQPKPEPVTRPVKSARSRQNAADPAAPTGGRAPEQTPSGLPAGAPRYLTLMRKEARITLDQADRLSSIVRTLNRARQGQGERITDNTLIRVAIGLLLERVEELHGTTEAELFRSLGLEPAE